MNTPAPDIVARYLVAQLCFGLALGLAAGCTILALDIAGIGSLAVGPTAQVVVVLASVLIFTPLVVATAIGLLAFDE